MGHRRAILLIDLVGSNWAPGDYTKHSCLEPYGLECIGAGAEKYGYEVKIQQPRYESFSRIINIVKSDKPFVVGLSVKTYNYNSSLRLARAIKEVNKNIYIVFG